MDSDMSQPAENEVRNRFQNENAEGEKVEENENQEEESKESREPIKQDFCDWCRRSFWRNDLCLRLQTPDKVYLSIVFANVLIYLSWKVELLEPFMMKYFVARFDRGIDIPPMILSTFSHCSIYHLLLNMAVLYGYTDIIVTALGWKQFLVMYTSAGMASSLFSHMVNSMSADVGGSLGASGAVMCLCAYVIIMDSDVELSVIFLPQYTYKASLILKVLVGFDMVGCILRWGLFDHAAHLGGSFFGIAWFCLDQYMFGRNENHLLHHNTS